MAYSRTIEALKPSLTHSLCPWLRSGLSADSPLVPVPTGRLNRGTLKPSLTQTSHLLPHQFLHLPVFFLLEFLDEAFKDWHLKLDVLGHLGRGRK